MNDQNTQKLFNDFPDLFDKDPEHPILSRGFECDDGWFDIVYRRSERINELRQNFEGSQVQRNSFKVVQVKQKWGGFRYYVDWQTETEMEMEPEELPAQIKAQIDEMYVLIGEAEAQAKETCEICGMKGELRVMRRWHKTLCEIHHRECEKKRYGGH